MPVEDDKYKAAELINWIKNNWIADYKDFLGRNNGQFYRTTIQQNFSIQPYLIKRLNTHGFGF